MNQGGTPDGSIDESVEQEFGRFRQAYHALFSRQVFSSYDAKSGITPQQYFDSMMFSIGTAVEFMTRRNVPIYLAKMAAHLSDFIGNEDYAGNLVQSPEASYQQRRQQFVSGMRYIIGIKDAAYNGDESSVSLREHSERVAAYSARLAAEMGFSQEYVEEVRIAGVLHDVGKIGIADDIIKKRGRLTQEEMERVKPHPEVGADLIRYAGFEPTSVYVLWHHRRYDGEGYPETREPGKTDLKDPKIGILAVADVFDVVSRGRPYVVGRGPHGAMRELGRVAGTQLHPELVRIASRTRCLVNEFEQRAA